MAFTLRAVGSWLLLSGMGWLGLGLGGCWLTGVDGPGARCLLASVDGPGEIYSLRFGRWPCLSGCGGVGALLDCPQGGATQGGGGGLARKKGDSLCARRSGLMVLDCCRLHPIPVTLRW